MKKLILKSVLYVFLILISLELLVRVFHLGRDTPTRFVDKNKVEKWVPNQNGYAVTGNRRQNFSEYHINNSGYNSYREFTPSKDKIEIALVGDSFIQGFHQDYYNSIGKKIENSLTGIEVYEYGYAGYDFADQLHLTYAYKDQFDAIDHVILGIKFSNDLTRNEYHIVHSRLALQSPVNKLIRKSKLLIYCNSIGILAPIQKLGYKIINRFRPVPKKKQISKEEALKIQEKKELQYLSNFESLVSKYGFDKDRFTLLLDANATKPLFLEYLDQNNFNYIDFSKSMEATDRSTTLIYDRHWNNHGRDIVAKIIVEYIHKNRVLEEY
ncbi:hypothetical protein [Aquimarina sp. 2201CG14-23]|uniref:hypothetical protein n=1 Tax=Aquimarina mycalae TaxID=3040073 RepID=UPI00247816A9|nr:hypothetical protein [Aquimarina sp. 2201CG14-23]MDH7446555.1 hypothetical protein [Aquimarina sp. 2201CG14-23]